MIAGVGVDIVKKERIEKLLSKYGNQLIEKILSETEIAEYLNVLNKVRYLSNHFAAKEATAKALGTGFSDGIQFKDICVVYDARGYPLLTFSGETRKIVEERKILQSEISISDDKEYSVAMVVQTLS